MPDSISTHSVGRGFAIADEVILSTTPRTRLVFRPALHGGGVRGHIARQKIGANGTWADTNDVNFTTLPPDCGVQLELDTHATRELFTKLEHLYQVQSHGVARGDHTFVVAEESEVVAVTDANKASIIRGLLEQGHSEEFWDALSASDPDLASKLAAGGIQRERERAIREFEQGLQDHPDDEAFWQEFFKSNSWMLQSVFPSTVYLLGDEVYLGGKGPVGRQGAGGVATDFLFSDDSTKSFAVVEIKVPDTPLVGGQYRGNTSVGRSNETYGMHGDLSGAIVQTRNQIIVAVDNFESVLGPGFEHKINRLHPKGILLIGMLHRLMQRQRDSFNEFRNGFHGLTILTYDELLKRLKLLYGLGGASGEADAESADDETGGSGAASDEPINLDDIPF